MLVDSCRKIDRWAGLDLISRNGEGVPTVGLWYIGALRNIGREPVLVDFVNNFAVVKWCSVTPRTGYHEITLRTTENIGIQKTFRLCLG